MVAYIFPYCCAVSDSKDNFVFLDSHVKAIALDKAVSKGNWPDANHISYDYNWPRLGWTNDWPNPDTD